MRSWTLRNLTLFTPELAAAIGRSSHDRDKFESLDSSSAPKKTQRRSGQRVRSNAFHSAATFQEQVSSARGDNSVALACGPGAR